VNTGLRFSIKDGAALRQCVFNDDNAVQQGKYKYYVG